jgi:arylsulfatase A-like enzyme
MPQKVKEIQKKPNILVIWGDDIGINNLSCYHGMMGYRTPNIDRLAQGRHDVYRLVR